MDNKIRISYFAHIKKLKEGYCVYNSLVCKKLFGKKFLKEIFESVRSGKFKEYLNNLPDNKKNEVYKVIKLLRETKVLCYEKEDTSLLKKLREDTSRIKINNFYFIPTSKCNFSCDYCNIPVKIKKKNASMTPKIIKKIVNKYKKYIFESEKKYFIISGGGEPTINFRAIEAIVKETKNIPGVEYLLLTNGSLIDERKANFLAKNKFVVRVSIDGPKEIHNKLRKTICQNNTFESALRGYNLLKKKLANVGISAVVGTHNVEKLDTDVADFLLKLKPKFIEMNMPHNLLEKKVPIYLTVDKYFEKLMMLFEKCREKGIPVEIIRRFLRPFITNQIVGYECSSMGNRILFGPSGEIGTCTCMMDESIAGNIDSVDDIKNNQVFKKWARRSTLNYKKCLSCENISICGSGCAYDGLIKKGSIYGIDENYCNFIRLLHNYFLEQTYEIIKHKLDNYSAVLPSKKDLEMISGKVWYTDPWEKAGYRK